MSIKELQLHSKRLRDGAFRAYQSQRTGQAKRIVRRETEREIRDAMERVGWMAAERAS